MMHCPKRSSLLAVGAVDFEFVRRNEAAGAGDRAHLALLRHAGEAAGQLRRRPCPCSARSLSRSIFGSPKLDAVVGGVRRLVDHLGGVQQRLRRNAADVEADAAEFGVALDQHHVHAEVGGAERGGVAAGAGAEHDQLAFDVGLAAAGRRPACGAASPRRGLRGGAARRAASRLRPQALRRVRPSAAAALRRSGASRPRGSRPPAPSADACRRPSPSIPSPRRRRGDGTSIVALSDSSVTRPWSFPTVSPGLTSSSITGTSLLSPMSGTRSSIVAMGAVHSSSRRRSPSTCAEVGGEARGRGAVDHAVVVAQRQRQHQPRRELAAVPHRLRRRLRHAEDRDFRRVDDRREAGAADAAERGDREAAALHVGRAELLVARLRADRRPARATSSSRPLRSQSRITGTTSPSGVSTAMPTWKYFFSTRFSSPSSEALKLRVLLQRRDHGLDQEHQRRDLDVLVLFAELLAEGLHLGDVGLVELRDVRDHRPVAREVGAGHLVDPRARLAPRPRRTWRSRPAATASAAGRRHRPPAAARAAGERAPSRRPARRALTMRPPRSLPRTCVRSTPSSRANTRTAGLAYGRSPRPPSDIGGRVRGAARRRGRRPGPAPAAAARAAAGAAAAGAGAAAAAAGAAAGARLPRPARAGAAAARASRLPRSSPRRRRYRSRRRP